MMPELAHRYRSPVITRLSALAALGEAALDALLLAAQTPRRLRVNRELIAQGGEIRRPLFILSGWAAHVRYLPDGRRQFLHLLLPGDLIGICEHYRPVAAFSVVALTEVEVCVAPDPFMFPTLRQAYAQSRAYHEAYLFAQITRLGRMSAQERIADLALEILDRLSLAGLAADSGFNMSLTQEVIGDVLGLTSVHINRTLQTMRREGVLRWQGGELHLLDPKRLRDSLGHTAVRVSGTE